MRSCRVWVGEGCTWLPAWHHGNWESVIDVCDRRTCRVRPVVRSTASLVTTLGCCYFGGLEEECTKHTDLGVGGWVIAGENVSSTCTLTRRHGGMYPMNLSFALLRYGALTQTLCLTT
jgi:hypothetical protein